MHEYALPMCLHAQQSFISGHLKTGLKPVFIKFSFFTTTSGTLAGAGRWS